MSMFSIPLNGVLKSLVLAGTTDKTRTPEEGSVREPQNWFAFGNSRGAGFSSGRGRNSTGGEGQRGGDVRAV